MIQQFGIFIFGAALSVLFCIAVRKFGPPMGMRAIPREDRWHTVMVPLGGGIGIYLSFLICLTLFAHRDVLSNAQYIHLIAVSTGMLALGLVDDLIGLEAHTKLLWQIAAASVLIILGFEIRLTPWVVANTFITVVWIVGITNAFNLLDNMDGLAAGIALIALLFRLMIFLSEGAVVGTLICLAMMGALLGFLIFNFNPAKIFMGDTGSLFLGFFVSGLVMTGTFPYTKSLVSVLILPVLLLLIPIFDTILVILSRSLSRRPVSVGGTDHASHRLVAVGISERKAVLLLYAMSAISGGIAYMLYQVGFSYSVMGLSIFLLGCICLGVYLSQIQIYPEEASPEKRGNFFTLLNNIPYKRQIATMCCDIILISAAFYAAFLLRFDDVTDTHTRLYADSLPVLLSFQLIANYLLSLYRHSWRYTSIRDLLAMGGAVAVGVLASLLLLSNLYGATGVPIPIFIIYGMTLFLLIAGFRLSFRILDQVLLSDNDDARRVLIYGCGDGGELLLREILRNAKLNIVPVGFIDDDPQKQNLTIHGCPVLGSLQSLARLLEATHVSEILISTEKLKPEMKQELAGIADEKDVTIRTFRLALEKYSSPGHAPQSVWDVS